MHGSDLMCNKILHSAECSGKKYFNILLHTKDLPKLIDHKFRTSIIFETPIKIMLSIRNILFIICVVRILIATGYFLLKKRL